jgi:hypothetical protein
MPSTVMLRDDDQGRTYTRLVVGAWNGSSTAALRTVVGEYKLTLYVTLPTVTLA